jgi:hypothetical protein
MAKRKNRASRIVFWISMSLLAWLFIYFTIKGDLFMSLLVAVIMGLVGSFMVFWEEK